MSSQRSILHDQRGAVMVVAVFMAAFLTGALWYIIGIGDAILYRERMQDGADAVAFAAAVYHARGMNMIAMINIIMAAILGVLVAFKLLQVINGIAVAVSCALAATGIGAAVFGPICTFTGNLVEPISNAVNAAERVVNATLPVLSKTQVGIAVAMPWVAEAKSVYISTQYYSKPVKGGGTISMSLIPTGERLGLPVQEDDYEFLCKKAGTYIGRLIFSPFGSFGNWVGGVVGGIVGTFPGYFCGSSGGGGGGSAGGGEGNIDIGDPASQIDLDEIVKKSCEQQRNALPEDERDDFDMDDCIEKGKKEAEANLDQTSSSTSTGVSGTNNKTSKRVYDDAQNGDGYFQIWSIVVGDLEWPQKADKGVQIAAWNQATATPPAPWGRVGFAQAEFYYDEAGAWDDYSEDALWNMKWRARLRRVRPNLPDVGGWLLGQLSGALAGKLDASLVNLLGSQDLASWVFGTDSQGAFEELLGNLLQSGSMGGSLKEHPMLYDLAGATVIH